MKWLSVVVALLKFATWLVQFLERAKLKAEGRQEANEEAAKVAQERIANANAAREDADALNADLVKLRESDGFRRD